MVYEYKVYCDDCCEFAYLNGFIGNMGWGKTYHEHDTFIKFMMKHGGHTIIILGQSADDLSREEYSEFKEETAKNDN